MENLWIKVEFPNSNPKS